MTTNSTPGPKTVTSTKTTSTAKAVAKPAPKPAVKPVAKPAAKPSKPAKVVKVAPKAYTVLTGIDDAAFCDRVCAKLAEGYELYGSPSLTFNGKNVIVAQAVIYKKKHGKGKKK